jgi:hypothetical protein
MFDNQEIEILTLDTDQTNGNMERVWQLIDLYNRIKTEPGSQTPGGNPNVNPHCSYPVLTSQKSAELFFSKIVLCTTDFFFL